MTKEPITEDRAALAEEVRQAIRGVPISVRALALELGLSHAFLQDVIDGSIVPTIRRGRSILAQVAALDQAFGTGTKTKEAARRSRT